MSDDDLIAVGIEFDQHIDPEEVQKRIENISEKEERYQIILSIYKEKIVDFFDRYYQNDKGKIYYIKPEYFFAVAGATKAQILQFSEEEAVVYLTYAGDYVEVDRPSGPMTPEEDYAVLLEMKAAAIANITGYVDLSEYRPEQQEEIRFILTKTIEDIDHASSVERVQKHVLDAENRLDAVKTDEQLKKEEQPAITPANPPEPTILPPNSETNPTVTPSQPELKPSITPSGTSHNPTVAPPVNEPKPTAVPPETAQKPTTVPPKTEPKPTVVPSKSEVAPTAAPQEKEPTAVPTATPYEIGGPSTVVPQDKEPTAVPTTAPQEKIPLSNGDKEGESTESEKPEPDRTVAAIVLITVTSLVLAIAWFIIKKKKYH